MFEDIREEIEEAKSTPLTTRQINEISMHVGEILRVLAEVDEGVEYDEELMARIDWEPGELRQGLVRAINMLHDMLEALYRKTKAYDTLSDMLGD